MLPHRDRSCRSNFLPHPVTVYSHQANQSQHWPYNTRCLLTQSNLVFKQWIVILCNNYFAETSNSFWPHRTPYDFRVHGELTLQLQCSHNSAVQSKVSSIGFGWSGYAMTKQIKSFRGSLTERWPQCSERPTWALPKLSGELVLLNIHLLPSCHPPPLSPPPIPLPFSITLKGKSASSFHYFLFFRWSSTLRLTGLIVIVTKDCVLCPYISYYFLSLDIQTHWFVRSRTICPITLSSWMHHCMSIKHTSAPVHLFMAFYEHEVLERIHLFLQVCFFLVLVHALQ